MMNDRTRSPRRLKRYKPLLWQLAAHLGLETFPEEIVGVDVFLPFMEKARAEGAVIFLKMDGERTRPDDAGQYMALLTHRERTEEIFRMDCDSLEDALAYVFVEYAERHWGFAPDED
ncbi:MAG: hypothetical protein ABIY70_08030 [Capsulimonas sp.]|uniref:hypothetical protein n=1 Tax=Capsulimonas sp. TaxID=2494211 RepID=UPI003265A39B